MDFRTYSFNRIGRHPNNHFLNASKNVVIHRAVAPAVVEAPQAPAVLVERSSRSASSCHRSARSASTTCSSSRRRSTCHRSATSASSTCHTSASSTCHRSASSCHTMVKK